MKRNKLTTVIITNRTDSRFENALKSAGFSHKVVVVNNTRDKTKNIFFEKLSKIYDFKLIDYEKEITSFSKIRNWAIERVETEWTFFLDSDEMINEKSQKEIIRIIENERVSAIQAKRIDYFLGKPLKYGEPGNTWTTRVVKTKVVKYVNKVHERAIVSGLTKRSYDIVIYHHSHKSISEFFRKVKKYSLMASKERKTYKLVNLFEMVFFPPIKAFNNLFIKLGILDGYRGIVYALMMSLHSLFVRIHRYENK